MSTPFRYYRGEFNGFYVKSLLLCKNTAVADVIEELVYHANMDWVLPGEETGGKIPVREEDIISIALFAGITRPLQFIETNEGSIAFTSSEVIGGIERSERGLYNPATGVFTFVHTAMDNYPTDILVEISPTARASMVDDDRVPDGYVPYGVDIFDASGNLIPGNLLSSPPVDGTPYTEYYGDGFLFFEETFVKYNEMPIDMFKAYFESIMRIRSTGASVQEFLFLTETLCDDYVGDIEIVAGSGYYTVYYTLNLSTTVDNRLGRLAAWLAVCRKRFKDFVMFQREV